MSFSSIQILDHGYVRLVDSMGSDLSIVRAARVSYNAAWRAGKDAGSDEKLIRYLWKHRHTSPFEAVEFQFEVYAPIFVIRQWQRHRTWSYNELSGRYRELPEQFYLPEAGKIGEQATDNKQGRIAAVRPGAAYELGLANQHCEQAFRVYKSLIEEGWPRELARMVLPLNTYTHMFAKVDLLNLLHFLTARLHEHAQYEIRVYAEALCTLAKTITPIALSAWEDG